ncbi:cytochrome P450 [Emydomyces testavorans]|uniref:Cytochrome P450 n=1 Tax=Emydomyces testavorans TaxID=2070801 RepID=A0AAF0DMS5_9EURO|nr:cytochrome P450 [Emydomyces testavorans]
MPHVGLLSSFVYPALLSLFGLICLYSLSTFLTQKRKPLPPGPPGLPIIGNMLLKPKFPPWETYRDWSKKYGGIMSLTRVSKTTIIINDYSIAQELLDKRGVNYSSRPQLPVWMNVSRGLNPVGMEYGRLWKTHRGLQASVLQPSMAKKYRLVEDIESRQVIYELLSTDDFSGVFRRFAGSLFLTLFYGERLPAENDAIRELEGYIRRSVELEEGAFQARALLGEFFPLISRIPSLFGSRKKETGAMFNRLTKIFDDKIRSAQATGAWNIVKELTGRKPVREMSAMEFSHSIGGLYVASLTPYQILRILVLGIILHPEAAAKARKEIDDVVGTERLPDFEDASRLPYLMALIKEGMRWRTFAPVGAERATAQEDEYMGYRIPKDSIIILNHWAMDNDKEAFGDPENFRPERWLENPDLPETFFGFGLRGCPGRHLSMDSLAIVTSRLLWAYNINHAYENGKKVIVDAEEAQKNAVATTIFSVVPDFKASFEIRDAKRRDIIEREWATAEKDATALLLQMMPETKLK